MGLSGMTHQMTIISLTVSCSLRAHQLCRKEKGNTKAARPSIVSSSSTQKSHTVSPKYVFCNSTAFFSKSGWQLGHGAHMWVVHGPEQNSC